MHQFLNAIVNGFYPVDQWVDPMPDLFDRIIFRRICRKRKEIQIGVFLNADRTAKEEYLAQPPDFLNSSSSQLPNLSERDHLNRLLAQLSEDAIRKVLVYAEALR